MRFFLRALKAEFLKTRRSKVPLITFIALSLGPLAGAMFMVILKDPEHARQMGLISAKAQLVGAADWPTFLSLLAQVVAIGGAVVFAFITAWVFGREFAERSMRRILAVPTPRRAIVAAKLAVIGAWCAALSVWVLGLGAALGALVGLPGYEAGMGAAAVVKVAATALMTIALLAPVALAASAGRGYLAPLGFAFLTVFLAQIAAATGWGEWVPWSVPALYCGMAGPHGGVPGAAGYVIVALTSLLGAAGTILFWSRADHA